MFRLFLFIIISIIITGCLVPGKKNEPEGAVSKTLSLYNWKEYTDLSVMKDFEKETGIKIVLYEYETPPMMMGDARANPGKYDVFIMEGYMVSSMEKLKLIEKLDLNDIPDYKNIKKEIREKPFYNHQGSYSVPYLWGSTGLVYNTKYVKENIDSWTVLWNKKYRGKIALLDDPRETMTALLKCSGYSLNSKNPHELKEAEKNALLLKKNDLKFGDTIQNVEDVIDGNIWIAESFNGDVFFKAGKRKDIKFVYPKEGYDIGPDYICISSDSKNKEGSYRFVNYLLRPDISARFTNSFFYPSPVEGAEKYIDREILQNPMIYPPADVLNRGEVYMELEHIEIEYERIFNLMK
ncbi:MAG: spermidine/putrescine ABC transporter substrate-binding protein [Candidatus Eremiobacterota bacterium]